VLFRSRQSESVGEQAKMLPTLGHDGFLHSAASLVVRLADTLDQIEPPGQGRWVHRTGRHEHHAYGYRPDYLEVLTVGRGFL
jgi:hypothetical protein